MPGLELRVCEGRPPTVTGRGTRRPPPGTSRPRPARSATSAARPRRTSAGGSSRRARGSRGRAAGWRRNYPSLPASGLYFSSGSVAPRMLNSPFCCSTPAMSMTVRTVGSSSVSLSAQESAGVRTLASCGVAGFAVAAGIQTASGHARACRRVGLSMSTHDTVHLPRRTLPGDSTSRSEKRQMSRPPTGQRPLLGAACPGSPRPARRHTPSLPPAVRQVGEVRVPTDRWSDCGRRARGLERSGARYQAGCGACPPPLRDRARSGGCRTGCPPALRPGTCARVRPATAFRAWTLTAHRRSLRPSWPGAERGFPPRGGPGPGDREAPGRCAAGSWWAAPGSPP